ncbi:hypothetical protein MKX03_014221 [Papaver bracteatum]|nr:hypothetical protein MKX03_014221 [Papaver bracteatum]
MATDDKARLEKFQIVRSSEEANEINTSSGPIVEELEISKFEHDPSSNSASTSISEEELEERMICVKKDPYLRHIVEDIETGAPTVMLRYLDDPEVLQKLARAMGFQPNVDTEDQIANESNPAANMSGNKRKRRSQKRPSKKQRIRRQRHLDDPEVLQKLGRAMGFAPNVDAEDSIASERLLTVCTTSAITNPTPLCMTNTKENSFSGKDEPQMSFEVHSDTQDVLVLHASNLAVNTTVKKRKRRSQKEKKRPFKKQRMRMQKQTKINLLASS